MIYLVLMVCCIMIVQCTFSTPLVRQWLPSASMAVLRTCVVGYSTVACLLLLEGCFVLLQS